MTAPLRVSGMEPLPGCSGSPASKATSERHAPRAAAFEPERWMGDGGPAQQASAVRRISMPFGAGPRICPGRCPALPEMKVAMITLLDRFDITAVDTRPLLDTRWMSFARMAGHRQACKHGRSFAQGAMRRSRHA